jgi:ADP-heptose:LPS heptosyltransferase
MNCRSRVRAWLGATQLLLCLQGPTILAAHLAHLFRRRRRSESVEAILVIRLDGLGDCVLTLPLLNGLRRCFPAARITVVAQPSTADIFLLCPDVDEVLSFEPLPRRNYPHLIQRVCTATVFFFSSLARRNFDLVLSPRWDIDVSMSTFLCALTRAPITVGYEDATSAIKAEGNKGFQNAFTVVLPAGPLKHEALRNIALARAIGCTQQASGPLLTVPATVRAEIIGWLPQRSNGLRIALGLPAGSAKRRWPGELYMAVLDELSMKRAVIPIAFIDAETEQVGHDIQKCFPFAILAGSFTLSQVAATLSECDIFLGSDSGLGQIAAAVGCATVTISPHPLTGDSSHTNSPSRFRPHGERTEVVQPTEGRAGCTHGCEADIPHCILDVHPRDVVAAILRLCPNPEGPTLQASADKPCLDLN